MGDNIEDAEIIEEVLQDIIILRSEPVSDMIFT